MSNDHYRGKTVVITGASTGFGRDTALELARRGCRLVLAARSADTLEEVAHECRTSGGEAIAVVADVSVTPDVLRLAEEAIREFGSIDVWINNAGVASIGRFDEVPLEDHEQVIRTDLIGTIAGSHVALRHFRARGAGTLINVASVIGKITSPYFASYAAAKFGVVGLCDALRQELREQKAEGIRVCTVMPMSHATEFFEHAGTYTGHEAAPIPPLYDPKVTVDKLVQLVAHPEDEVITGGQGKFFNVFHRLFPRMVEAMMADKSHKAEFKDPPPAVASSGAVHEPSER